MELLSSFVAFGIMASFVVLFIGLLYATSSGRKDRDSDEAIKARTLSVALGSLISGIVIAWTVLKYHKGGSWLLFLQFTGVYGGNALFFLFGLLWPIFMTVSLFLGPMVQNWFDEGKLFPQHQEAMTLWKWRRNFVVAPFAEEWVFRSCMCPLLYLAGYKMAACTLLPPIFFGIAHTHHVLSIMKEKQASLVQAVVVVGFQLFYTTLFGSMAAFYLLVTGNIFGAMISHSFCNRMGFPDFGGALQHETKRR